MVMAYVLEFVSTDIDGLVVPQVSAKALIMFSCTKLKTSVNIPVAESRVFRLDAY
jgi:hypothetical protein